MSTDDLQSSPVDVREASTSSFSRSRPRWRDEEKNELMKPKKTLVRVGALIAGILVAAAAGHVAARAYEQDRASLVPVDLSIDFDPKACHARCMEEINDRQKCDRICDPKQK
ncbi:hypothetical protein [Roseateles sp.]|uniref:hypothetical protein n=1 Tax=Roseateles sp. TaxID=1971397 RepID=UPI0031DDBC42